MGRPRGRPRKNHNPELDSVMAKIDDEFGYDGPEHEVAPDPSDQVTPPAPEILALGPMPEDAAAIQKWNYRLLSTMAALAARDASLSPGERERRVMKLTQAAARHYPEAARYDLSQKIERDAEQRGGKNQRARAAAQAEPVRPAGSAKVVPIRPPDSGN